MTDGKRFVIRTPLDLHREALAKAAAEGLSLSDIIRTWLSMWLRGELETPIRQI
jgi:predicted HicB family RNase H-like nuclease